LGTRAGEPPHPGAPASIWDGRALRRRVCRAGREAVCALANVRAWISARSVACRTDSPSARAYGGALNPERPAMTKTHRLKTPPPVSTRNVAEPPAEADLPLMATL